ncbi:MAG TPA: DUF4058 family protein [Tepidisphaeraceae bacterium]|nr:DUF4058 family protein [Tepidisphaeraceae bacterium]
MPSPFPGMDPYLEREEVWHDFHERFIPYAAAMLTPQVRPQYIVKLDEHVYIHELPADDRRLIGRSDVSLSRDPRRVPTAGAAIVTAAPAHARVPTLAIDEERLSYIEIRDRDDLQVVTVIELLSPSNKHSGRREYLMKRRAYLESGIRLVGNRSASRRPPHANRGNARLRLLCHGGPARGVAGSRHLAHAPARCLA